MKKFVVILMVALMIVSVISGCSAPATQPEEGSSETPQVEPIVMQLGYENHPGEPVDLGAKEWARLVEEKSGGTMKIDVFPSSQLGAKNDLIDQMLAGDSVITLGDGAFYADRGVPDFGIVFAPYLFDTWEQAWTLIESDWYKEQTEKLAENGLQLLSSNWVYGDRHTLTRTPVRSIDDLAGMRIRVPNNTIQVKGFEVLGASPTPMPLGDVYTALQQGTIDGFEQPIAVIYAGKFHEAAKYLTLNAHVRNFTTWITGTEFFNSLTEEQQNILIEAGNEAGIYSFKEHEKAEAEAIEKLKAEGVELIEVDMDEFKAAAEKFYSLPEFTSIWSPNLYETVKDAMK